jgi:hypothetical protein
MVALYLYWAASATMLSPWRGTALAFHLAARRPEFVGGVAFMEFIRPMPTWEDFHQVPAAHEIFRKFRTPGEGERMILDGNAFVERVLPGAIKRKLSEEELAVYRAPFPAPQPRIPTWRLPNELPIAGEPADVYATLEAAHAALAFAIPSCSSQATLARWYRRHLPSVSPQPCIIASSSSSAQARTICRRISPRRSARSVAAA